MSQMVEFEVKWNGRDKIAAIKMVRSCTHADLIKTKGAIEEANGVFRKWRMTPKQFGMFVAKTYGGDPRGEWNFQWVEARLIDFWVDRDFTTD